MAVVYSQNGTIVREVVSSIVASSRRIDSQQGINVVDENGYIGAVITDYFPHTGNTYYNNFAVVVNNADFSHSGLGQVTFITPGTTDIGGRTYRTVNIGGVEWLAENLDFKFSGCNIGGTGSPTTPNAWYYDNDEATYGIDGTRKCGLLYNWYAVNLLEANKSTLCPGWHVASSTEWESLQAAVGGSSTAGKKLKAINNSIGGNWPTNWGGTDDYYFTALPSGYRSGFFREVGTDTSFWSSTQSGNNAYIYNMATGRDSINTYNDPKTNAFPTRLVRDT